MNCRLPRTQESLRATVVVFFENTWVLGKAFRAKCNFICTNIRSSLVPSFDLPN